MSTLVDPAVELSGLQANHDVAIAKDVGAMFHHLDGHPHFPSLVHQALPEIIDQHAQAAGLYTTHWYDGLDSAAKFKAKPYVDLSPEQISKTVNWALYAPGDEPPVSRLTGSSQRIVRNTSRNT